eukprot:tig00000492_g1450.t1
MARFLAIPTMAYPAQLDTFEKRGWLWVGDTTWPKPGWPSDKNRSPVTMTGLFMNRPGVPEGEVAARKGSILGRYEGNMHLADVMNTRSRGHRTVTLAKEWIEDIQERRDMSIVWSTGLFPDGTYQRWLIDGNGYWEGQCRYANGTPPTDYLTNKEYAHWINPPEGAVNARFMDKWDGAYLVATSPIRNGDEIIVNYGPRLGWNRVSICTWN